jgi:hypothetical protein
MTMSEFDSLMDAINAGKYLKRLKWKRDEPATDKQFNYAEALLNRVKGRLPPFSLIEDLEEKLAWQFWQHGDIPDDLTKKEASALIDGLLHANERSIPRGMVEAILKRIEGGPQVGTPAIMFTCLWAQSSQFVLDAIAEQMPRQLQAAMAIRDENDAKKAAEKQQASAEEKPS